MGVVHSNYQFLGQLHSELHQGWPIVFHLKCFRVAAEKAVEISDANATKTVLVANLNRYFPEGWKFKGGKKLSSDIIAQITKVSIFEANYLDDD